MPRGYLKIIKKEIVDAEAEKPDSCLAPVKLSELSGFERMLRPFFNVWVLKDRCDALLVFDAMQIRQYVRQRAVCFCKLFRLACGHVCVCACVCVCVCVSFECCLLGESSGVVSAV